MTKYPYYIISYFEEGILKKVFNGYKFNTCSEAIHAMLTRNDNEIISCFMNKTQIMILEYSEKYLSRIVIVYNNRKDICNICEPINK